MNTIEEESKKVARNFYEGFNTRDLQTVFDKYVSENLVNHMTMDREGWLRFDQGVMAAISDLKVTVVEQVAEGNKVVTHWLYVGKHTEKLFNRPATGNPIKLEAVSIDTIKDGKIAEHKVFADFTQFMQQFER
ncbi:MAG TPA: ester cyclase [Patescibacteria group bacterium]|nr:ester cyclase [Patescibacteria group bacterium]